MQWVLPTGRMLSDWYSEAAVRHVVSESLNGDEKKASEGLELYLYLALLSSRSSGISWSMSALVSTLYHPHLLRGFPDLSPVRCPLPYQSKELRP